MVKQTTTSSFQKMILFAKQALMALFLGISFLMVIASTTKAMESQLSDKDLMQKARNMYEANQLDAAIDVYTKIPVTSDFWLEALEERAWAYTRQGNYPKALADLKSITHPVWSAQVGPESIMLSAFVSLKICAYKDTLEKVDLFKKRMLTRVTALENLQQKPVTPELMKFLTLAAENKLPLMDLGKRAERYPRYFFRDRQLISAFSSQNQDQIKDRMLTLVDRDLAEIKKNLTKMKVIEIEVIQRVATMTKMKQTKKNLNFARYDKSQQVSFPISDDEVWLDEMGSFEVKSQSCEN